MNLYDLLCVLAAFLILVTALVRLNDIGREKTSKRWWTRRLGLLLTFASMAMFISAYFTAYAPYWKQIQVAMFLWGVLLTWMTTPDMPPWHKLITRYDPKPEAEVTPNADQ